MSAHTHTHALNYFNNYFYIFVIIQNIPIHGNPLYRSQRSLRSKVQFLNPWGLKKLVLCAGNIFVDIQVALTGTF